MQRGEIPNPVMHVYNALFFSVQASRDGSFIHTLSPLPFHAYVTSPFRPGRELIESHTSSLSYEMTSSILGSSEKGEHHIAS